MAHELPGRDVEVGVVDGLAYALVAPAGRTRGGVVVIHGAGSCKENHLDFAHLCAGAGLVAIAFDQRGHGASGGALDGRALDDVATVADLLPAAPVFLRGSSMGAFVALAAAERTGARAVVAICPASGAQLTAGVRAGRFEFRADVPALVAMLASVDLGAAARGLGANLLLLHAEADDRVPIEHSAELHEHAAGSTFVRVPGGDHGSVQHDPVRQDQALRFLLARTA